MTKVCGPPKRERAEAEPAQVAGPLSPEPVLLIIADISGYTRYMTANAKTLSHSQAIITELIEVILQEIELPLEVAKLEGDAIFLYCRKNGLTGGWMETRRVLGEKLLAFFPRFTNKVAELSGSTACTCNACTHIERLRLKVVVHSGEALFHRVFNFVELAGVDVIIVHRLLKNSVEGEQYLLLTERAARDLDLPQTISHVKGVERYDDIGRVDTFVYHLPGGNEAASGQNATEGLAVEVSRSSDDNKAANFGTRFGRCWSLYWKLWFAPLSTSSKDKRFHHVAAATSVGRRVGLGFLTVLLTPFMLLVGTASILRRAVSRRDSRLKHREHAADCKCDQHS
jgi:hypothetical protein